SRTHASPPSCSPLRRRRLRLPSRRRPRLPSRRRPRLPSRRRPRFPSRRRLVSSSPPSRWSTATPGEREQPERNGHGPLPRRRRRQRLPPLEAPCLAGLAAMLADDSSPAPFEMTVVAMLKLLGVTEGTSFNWILRAKKAVAASCKDDPDAVAQVPP
uniref:Uncharacterized protein n=1 Tax=Aegilops tauschii subsp. strangulata TaxID=200361 RepID=A0A453A1Z3_AEGTS